MSRLLFANCSASSYQDDSSNCKAPESLRLRFRRDCVSAVANRWGFWHLGQLAADYRNLFDELPSETLAR
jgi:hypothetical protein